MDGRIDGRVGGRFEKDELQSSNASLTYISSNAGNCRAALVFTSRLDDDDDDDDDDDGNDVLLQ